MGLIQNYRAFITSAVFPEEQDKVYKEIMAVTGGQRLPTWSDRAQMPYANAFLLELGRWNTLIPLNLNRM